MDLKKVVENEQNFDFPANIWAFSLFLRVDSGGYGRVIKFEADVTQILLWAENTLGVRLT